MFNAGTAVNIIPDTASLGGTARTLNETSRALIKQSLKRRLQGVAEANNCQLQLDWSPGSPSTVNDSVMAEYVAKIALKVMGKDCGFTPAKPTMAGEDFAYYLEKVPGCFFLVGVQKDSTVPYPSLHNNHYDFADAALKTGIQMFVNLAKYFCDITSRGASSLC